MYISNAVICLCTKLAAEVKNRIKGRNTNMLNILQLQTTMNKKVLTYQLKHNVSNRNICKCKKVLTFFADWRKVI